MPSSNFRDACLLSALLFLSSILTSCAQSYVAYRKSQYTEKWSKTLTTQLQERDPAHTYTISSGSNDGATLNSISGITLGNYWKSNDLVFDLAFYFENYGKLSYAYEFTGATSGSGSQSLDVIGSGIEASVGYQAFSFLRPYVGLRRDTISATTMGISSSGSFNLSAANANLIFAFAGVGLDCHISNSTSLTAMADYGISLTKENFVQESSEFNIQAGLRWGWGGKE